MVIKIFQLTCLIIAVVYLGGCTSKTLQICPNQTFLQIYETSPGVAEDSDKLFQKTRGMGFDTVFLQWSSYDDVSFYPDLRPAIKNDARLTSIIQAACKADVKLWLGLHHDSQFWERSAQSKAQVKTYLNQRLIDLKQRLSALDSAINHASPYVSCIKGWYISDEIDDMTWADAEYQQLLINHLKATKQLLKKSRPKWPVAISGFTNRVKNPLDYAQFWDSLLTETGIDLLLFQDGVGAGKLTLETEEAYIQSLTVMALKNDYDVSVVVELFNMKKQKDGSNNFSSASVARVKQQLALAEKAGAEQLAVFAATPYLLQDDMKGKKKLATFWRDSLLNSCKGTSD